MNRVGYELADPNDSSNYMDYQDNGARGLLPSEDYEKDKEMMPIESSMDYEEASNSNSNQSPSLRDQEYLQHSSLWSHSKQQQQQDATSNLILNTNKDRHKTEATKVSVKDEKTEANLPAYCTPPNPCPIGYTSELIKIIVYLFICFIVFFVVY